MTTGSSTAHRVGQFSTPDVDTIDGVKIKRLPAGEALGAHDLERGRTVVLLVVAALIRQSASARYSTTGGRRNSRKRRRSFRSATDPRLFLPSVGRTVCSCSRRIGLGTGRFPPRRRSLSRPGFDAHYDHLIARGFPKPDPDTGRLIWLQSRGRVCSPSPDASPVRLAPRRRPWRGASIVGGFRFPKWLRVARNNRTAPGTLVELPRREQSMQHTPGTFWFQGAAS